MPTLCKGNVVSGRSRPVPRRGVGGRAATAAPWQTWHVSPTWRGRNEAQKRSRAAPQGPGFIPGLRLFCYPAWVRMHLRAESWCLGGEQPCGRACTFCLPGVAEMRHGNGVGWRPRARFYSRTPPFLLPCVGENAPEDGVAGAGRARFACLAWQKGGTEAESGGAPGPGFIPGLRFFGYPAWVRMHLRTESWCLGAD